MPKNSEPEALLLVQGAHPEVNLKVELSIRVIVPAAAVGAGTHMNFTVGHDDFSVK
jgi:hypothetical protein